MPSALLTPLTSSEDNSSQSFPNGLHCRCCSADTIADELLKILHYYSVLSLSLLPSCPAPGFRGPWLSLRNACRPQPSRAGFSTPSLKVAPTGAAAGQRHWVSPRAGGSHTRAPDPALGRTQGACAGTSVLRGLYIKKWLERDLCLPGVLVRETPRRCAHSR